mgnify:FL=1
MKLNEEAFDFLGITKFHESGYTGKNITIASKESIIQGVFDDVDCDDYFTFESKSAKHGTTVMDYIRQVVPDARKIACDFSGITEKNVWKCEGMEKLLSNLPQVFTSSSYNSSDSQEHHMKKYRELREKGCFLVHGAGNDGEDGVLNVVKNDVFKAVAAYKLFCGKPKKESFSSVGEEVDFASLDNLRATWDNKRHTGTSFSAPIFAGMVGLVQDFFIAKTGKQLSYENLLQFIKDNCIDLEETGIDNKSGFGLFILPEPDSIEISRYINTKGENKTMSEENKNTKTYKTLEDIPAWGKTTVEKLVKKKAIQGDENGDLNISNDLLRTLVIHDRLGLYD